MHPLAPPLYTPAARALPPLALVRQHFDATEITDVHAAIAAGFAEHGHTAITPGMRVAITGGSRGIANISAITAAVAAAVRALQAEPFVVGAMGSHGGASADGQRAVLESYGITPEAVGCPVVTTTDVVHIGSTAAGIDAYVNRAAFEADAIILLNRVKPHSMLVGEQGSGLMKMAGIGLGNPTGADSIHLKGLQEHMLPVARLVLQRAPIKLGVAIVENSFDRTWKIAVLPADAIEEADRRLLAEARALLPNLPFDPIDLLVVDRIGKNYSGTGMDPNVIGMHRRMGGPPQRQIGTIVALDLSPESHGNANGVGMADIITARLRDAIDWHATYANAMTSQFLHGVKLPIACATAQEAVTLAMKPFEPDTVRLVRVHNTAHLHEFWVSPALLADLARFPTLEQASEPQTMQFDQH